MTDLFDCAPRMAAKLARCNEIARAQLASSRDRAWSSTHEMADVTSIDGGIIARRAAGPSNMKAHPGPAICRYLDYLNA